MPEADDGLRAALAEAHHRNARYVNLREGWRGHLFQERFAGYPMDHAHLMAAARYAEQSSAAGWWRSTEVALMESTEPSDEEAGGRRSIDRCGGTRPSCAQLVAAVAAWPERASSDLEKRLGANA